MLPGTIGCSGAEERRTSCNAFSPTLEALSTGEAPNQKAEFPLRWPTMLAVLVQEVAVVSDGNAGLFPTPGFTQMTYCAGNGSSSTDLHGATGTDISSLTLGMSSLADR